jgi:predicted kinase
MTGMKMVNSDKELKFLLNKYGFGTDLDKMPDEVFKDLTSKGQSGLRDFAKSLTKQRMKLYQKGKLGMIIDGTGHDYNKIAKMKKELEEDGYDTYMVFVGTDLEVAQKRNQQRDRVLPPELVKKSWTDVMSNGKKFISLFGKSNMIVVPNNQPLNYLQAMRKFETIMKKSVGKFLNKPIKNKIAKSWIKKQQILKQQGLSEAPRVPRKKGQHRGSKSHSDLYTDENPKGTIKGLKFATVKDAQKSVNKIKNSGKSHAHKIQAAVAMEQRAREMGKTSQAAVYRAYINKMKKKTKKMNEKWSDKYKKSIDCSNPKGF